MSELDDIQKEFEWIERQRQKRVFINVMKIFCDIVYHNVKEQIVKRKISIFISLFPENEFLFRTIK